MPMEMRWSCIIIPYSVRSSLFGRGRTTLAHVENELGAITLRLRTDRYERTPTHIHVDYAIMDGADGSDTFEFRIEMRGGRK